LTSTAFFIAGCSSQAPTVTQKPVSATKEANTTKVIKEHVPQRSRKKIKLKKVEDDNFSEAYMYPEDRTQKEKAVKVAAANTTYPAVAAMGREECIGMIGQEKFDKYTQMFGNEASSIKRCAMLKAMQ
jgi:hypothetical protein